MFFILLPTTVVSGDAGFSFDKYSFQAEFPPGERSIKLPHNFLIPDSEKVYIDTLLLVKNADYDISWINGKIELTESPPQKVIVQYQVFPWNLKRYYYHRTMPEPTQYSEYTESVPKTPDGEKHRDGIRLNRSGSIFRSVTVGSDRDASLDSGVELNLNGRLGRNTTVTAALSDQNVPLQPQGDTRTIEEIDKVYVNVQSDNIGANLGDYNLAIENREFASLNRKLTGAQAYIETDNYKAMVSGASSKGEFHSNSFNGTEGLQGPYILTGKNGQTAILVLAGTEKIWVDGLPLTRGDNYDYIIDYTRGEITFTEKIPVSADSRVVVDFQYSAQEYPRNLYHAAGEIDLLDDKLTLNFAGALETDAKNDPLSVSLTDDAKSALKSAGENPQNAVVPGEEFVGTNEGDYFKPDTLPYFVWAGRDSGDYDVTFSFIGDGLGSYDKVYSAAGDIYYQWLGAGAGDYDAVILLPLPERHEIADFGLKYRPFEGAVLSFEGAASRLDPNTYSSLDDGDNTGFGYTGQFTLDSIPVSNNSGILFGAKLKARNVDDNFRQIDRIEEAEYSRKWGYSDTLSVKEESYNAVGYVIPIQYLTLSGGGGLFEKSDFRSVRKEAGLDYLDNGLNKVHLFLEEIATEAPGDTGYWRRAYADLSRKIRVFTPAFSYEGEDKSSDLGGFRFQQYTPSFRIGENDGLLLEYTYRDDHTRMNGPLERLSILRKEHLLYERVNRNSDILLDYTHSERNYSTPDSADIKSDLGRMEFNARTEDGGVIFNFKHRITQSRTAETALIPVEVGWGEGDYIEQDGQYYPDENGNYILVPQPTGEFTPSSKVKSSVNLRIDFRKMSNIGAGFPNFMKLISTDTYFEVDEESSADDPWKLYVLYLPEFRNDSTRIGSQTARQDVFYRRGDRDFSLRFRILDTRSLNRQLVSVDEQFVQDEYSVNVWKSLSPQISFQSMFSYAKQIKWLSSLPDREISFIKSDNQMIQQILRPLELRFGFGMESAYDRVDDLRSIAVNLNPQLEYSITGKGRITINGSWTGVFSDEESLPYEMTSGNGVGSNYSWGASAGFRLSNNLNLTANYTGESKIDRPVIHTGRMELRAFF